MKRNLDEPCPGLQKDHICALANRLGVDKRVALAETLAHCAIRKHQKGESLLRTDLVEAWDALPDYILSKDEVNKEARLLILGLNPRKPTVTTVATHSLPNLTQPICTYVVTLCPKLTFTTLSLRLNADKGPHRDLGNSSDPGCIQVLTPETVGGNLWIADVKGDVLQWVHGSRVPGKIVECHAAPFQFNSKHTLHATEAWTGPRRIVLTAWTVMSAQDISHHRAELQRAFGFPNVSPVLPPPQQITLQQAFEAGAREQHADSATELIIPVSSSESSSQNSLSQPRKDTEASQACQHAIDQDSDSFTPTLQDED